MQMTGDQTNRPPVRVGLVENDPDYLDRIRAALEELSEIAAVHAWPSAEAYWRDPAGKQLELLFLDIKLDGMNGVDLTAKITERSPEIAIVMLSNLNSDDMIFQALRNGAIGYLLKAELHDIAETVRTVLGGGATMTPTIALQVLTSFRQAAPVEELPGLTAREMEILQLMVKGKTSQKVAERLGCSVNTVNHHAKSIYRKLNVHNRSELARKAAAAGLLDS